MLRSHGLSFALLMQWSLLCFLVRLLSCLTCLSLNLAMQNCGCNKIKQGYKVWIGFNCDTWWHETTMLGISKFIIIQTKDWPRCLWSGLHLSPELHECYGSIWVFIVKFTHKWPSACNSLMSLESTKLNSSKTFMTSAVKLRSMIAKPW